MVAVVAPHRHLLLRVVQRVELPPPAKLVLGAVEPVIAKIKNQQIQHKTHPGRGSHLRPQVVDLKGRQAPDPQQAHRMVQHGLQGKEHGHPKQPQPMDQGVEHVGAHGSAVSDRLDRPPALQGGDYQQQHQELQQANEQPARGFIGRFQQPAKAQSKQHRLKAAFVQPGLGLGKTVNQKVHGACMLRRVLTRGGQQSSLGKPGAS